MSLKSLGDLIRRIAVIAAVLELVALVMISTLLLPRGLMSEEFAHGSSEVLGRSLLVTGLLLVLVLPQRSGPKDSGLTTLGRKSMIVLAALSILAIICDELYKTSNGASPSTHFHIQHLWIIVILVSVAVLTAFVSWMNVDDRSTPRWPMWLAAVGAAATVAVSLDLMFGLSERVMERAMRLELHVLLLSGAGIASIVATLGVRRRKREIDW